MELSATYAHPVMVAGPGIDRTGAADCAPALQAIINSAPAGSTLYFPSGTYRVNTALTIPSYLTLRGEGYQTRIDWRGNGTLVTLASKTQVKFRDLRIHLFSPTAVGIDLSNSFRCSTTGVIIEGEHLATTGATYQMQKGIIFRDNAGDNRVIDCDLNNLGIGIETASAQNYVVGGTFGTCWRSISGGDPTGAVYLAGISVTNTTFVGGIGATDCHFYVGGSAAEWLISQVWAEKCDKAVVVGTAAGGPRTFALRDSYAAGVSCTINIRNARQPLLDNITFSSEEGDTPTDLVIHPDVTYGYAKHATVPDGSVRLPREHLPGRVDCRRWAHLTQCRATADGVGELDAQPACYRNSGRRRELGRSRLQRGPLDGYRTPLDRCPERRNLVECEPLSRHLGVAASALEGTQPGHLHHLPRRCHRWHNRRLRRICRKRLGRAQRDQRYRQWQAHCADGDGYQERRLIVVLRYAVVPSVHAYRVTPPAQHDGNWPGLPVAVVRV